MRHYHPFTISGPRSRRIELFLRQTRHPAHGSCWRVLRWRHLPWHWEPPKRTAVSRPGGYDPKERAHAGK